MHIASAGMLFAEGKTDEAKEELTKAAELWPGNPKIDEVMAQTQDQMMQKNTLQKDFDRLVAERNFREIYKRKHEFSGLVGLTKDAARQEQLEKIIADILLIETAVAKTKELENSAIPGATFAAWEEIQQLVGKHPDDTDLRIRAEELSRKASDFVSALQRASEAQRVGNTGSALAWLLKARTIYPDSKRAKDGIQLILDRVLPADADLFDPPGGNFDGDALQPAASPRAVGSVQLNSRPRMTPPPPEGWSLACPLPIDEGAVVRMAHGGGGRLTRDLLDGLVLPGLSPAGGGPPHDAAVLAVPAARLAFTTDSYVVHPLEFPGGDVASLAVHGTVNDLAMAGARPLWLSAAFIIEEGLPLELLRRLVASLRAAADACGVQVVTGDTKVVDRGKGDGIFINTAGIGACRTRPCHRPGRRPARRRHPRQRRPRPPRHGGDGGARGPRI
jgi:tetratricopeptide (TPR) repeat protein